MTDGPSPPVSPPSQIPDASGIARVRADMFMSLPSDALVLCLRAPVDRPPYEIILIVSVSRPR